jgi:hypothetical protein
MEGFTLTILDSTGIQEYIFGSNKLKENIGASHLLVQVSTEWLYQALEQVAPGAHNFSVHPTTISQKPLEKDSNQKVEVIYSGGGNVVILSRNKIIAKDVVRALSRKLLENAPGLEITVAHRPLVANDKIGGADGAYNDLLRTLNSAKQQRRQSMPQLGLSVTLACRATGLPAVHFDDEENRHVSAEIQAKLVAVDGENGEKGANERLQEKFHKIAEEYAFSKDFDDFGRSRDDSSYIAVVHADGNGIGKRFEQLVAQFDGADKNRDCLDELRALSQAVEQSAEAALHEAIGQLSKAFGTQNESELDERMRRFATGLQQDKEEHKPIFPVRPLVFGGDDMTLVCDGRLGLALAAAYLKAFHKHTKEKLQTPAYACAGIAIVKAHYPFARAYTLSSDLCDSAKAALRKEKRDASAMDWHFAATGINADLRELRKRQYWVEEGDLTMRPITVDGQGINQQWREWNTLRQLIETFVNDEAWRDRRNKVIALREALRAGKNDVGRFRRNYQIRLLPALHGGDDNLRETGWKDGRKNGREYRRSGYFDAIEALDFYLPIELAKEEAS